VDALRVALRLGGGVLFVLSVAQAIHPRPLDAALFLSIAVLLLFAAEAVAPRRRVK
jgi:hypothetical protein